MVAPGFEDFWHGARAPCFVLKGVFCALFIICFRAPCFQGCVFLLFIMCFSGSFSVVLHCIVFVCFVLLSCSLLYAGLRAEVSSGI